MPTLSAGVHVGRVAVLADGLTPDADPLPPGGGADARERWSAGFVVGAGIRVR
ncbi:MAG: hypothetical protein R3E98_01825 [Gemmatimonadota bacterium]